MTCVHIRKGFVEGILTPRLAAFVLADARGLFGRTAESGAACVTYTALVVVVVKDPIPCLLPTRTLFIPFIQCNGLKKKRNWHPLCCTAFALNQRMRIVSENVVIQFSVFGPLSTRWNTRFGCWRLGMKRPGHFLLTLVLQGRSLTLTLSPVFYLRAKTLQWEKF